MCNSRHRSLAVATPRYRLIHNHLYVATSNANDCASTALLRVEWSLVNLYYVLYTVCCVLFVCVSCVLGTPCELFVMSVVVCTQPLVCLLLQSPGDLIQDMVHYGILSAVIRRGRLLLCSFMPLRSIPNNRDIIIM